MPSKRALISLVKPEWFKEKSFFLISSAFGLPWHNESLDAPLSGAPESVLLIGDLYCFVTCFFSKICWNELHQRADAEQGGLKRDSCFGKIVASASVNTR
jgi:hypothetical protein